MKRPSKKQLERVFDWLKQYDLYVYGANISLEDFIYRGGYRDYSAEECIKLHDLWKKKPEGPTEESV